MLSPALHQLTSTLRLQLRNRMGMIYGYIFPTIFLVSFWVLYRYEPVPLIRHLGELLTVTALGGACFGLPTSLVAERERGVWRRYRLTPVATGALVAGTVAARYLLLLSAALLQLLLALALGMPLPDHPLGLFVAFTFVAFAFLGLGLVIAMLADNVPAVQALGQSVFLPMLIIGGVAVRLESLPAWAQTLSAFFPGRWAVQALHESAMGGGLAPAGFALLALTLIGGAGCVAAARIFRWDARERFATRGGKGWLGLALGSWAVVGLMAVAGPGGPAPVQRTAAADSTPRDTFRVARPAQLPPVAPDTVAQRPAPEPALAAVDSARPTAPAPTEQPPARAAAPWESVTDAHIAALDFSNLPPDKGVVAPVAGANDLLPYPELAEELECLRTALLRWEPAAERDPVQRVRNLLMVAAVPDAVQIDWLEPWVPLEIFDYIRADIHEPNLSKILYWIAIHPDEGDDAAADMLAPLCIELQGQSASSELIRERVALYAVKLLARLHDKL